MLFRSVVALLVANAIACPVFMFRMAGALGWSRREVLLGTSAVPMLALMVGIGISMAIDVLATRAGLGGWTGVVAVSSSGALGALAVLIVSGHLPWHEVRALLFVRGARGTNA